MRDYVVRKFRQDCNCTLLHQKAAGRIWNDLADMPMCITIEDINSE